MVYIKYICAYCSKVYTSKEMAHDCENRHKKDYKFYQDPKKELSIRKEVLHKQ